MKLQKKENTVISSGVQSETEFSIAMNDKMFRILSDGLYKDKVGSIVREISCNGRDSHVESGQADRPIDIHLPDGMEPWFSVRDYGLGLSPDDIVNVYSSYGESTKDESNLSVGAFGLGAKTPFAYKSQFTVTSIFDGVKYIYSANISESGTPNLSLLSETPTDEGNGVEITIPVNKNDFNDFRSKVASQLRFFTVKPNILNYHEEFEFKQFQDNVYSSANADLYGGHTYGHSLWIVQGGVGYPADIHQISDHIAKGDHSKFQFLKKLSGYLRNIVLHFDIGEIEVIVSREEIAYTEFTINSIMAKVDQLHEELVKEVKTKIQTLPTPWEQAKFLNSNKLFSDIARSTETAIIEGAALDGTDKYCFNSGDLFVKETKTTINEPDGSTKTLKGRSRHFSVLRYEKNYITGQLTLVRKASSDVMIPTDNPVFVRDTTKKPIARVAKYLTDNNYDSCYMISRGPDNPINKLDEVFTDETIEKISKQFGQVPIQRAIDCEAPETASTTNTTSGPRMRVTAYKEYDEFNCDSTYYWSRIDEDIDKITPGIYVTVHRYHFKDITMDQMRMLSKIKDSTVPVYAFNERTAKEIEKISGWVKGVDFVDTEMAKLRSNPKNVEYFQMVNFARYFKQALKGFNSRYFAPMYERVNEIECDKFKWFLGEQVNRNYWNEVESFKNKHKIKADALVISDFDTNVEITDAQQKLIDDVRAMEDEFCLFNSLSQWDRPSKEEVSHAILYVNSVSA